VSGYVVDASVAIKWFLPETHSETALRLQHLNHRPHAPAFVMLELGNILTKKIRRNELTQEEGKAILQDLKHIPLQRHSDMQLFRQAYALARHVSKSVRLPLFGPSGSGRRKDGHGRPQVLRCPRQGTIRASNRLGGELPKPQ
jgi:predicted nucleic acid-binding protein